MAASTDTNVMERLLRALYPVDPTKADGAWQMRIPGGSGGTSSTDNSPYTPGSSSLTPMGGYFGGRSVSSGNIAAPALSSSAILQVDVVAGGAGGGVSQTQIQGTSGNWVNVGVASGNAGAAGNWALPVTIASGVYPTVNIAGGITVTANLGGIATVNLGLGTVNVGNVIVATLSNVATVNLGLGTVNIGNIPAVVGTVQVFPVGTFTVWSANGAGGGAAQLQVVGTDNTSWKNVGFQSGDYGAFNVVPMIYASGHYATVNIGNVLVATVNPGSIFTVNLGLGTVNIGNVPAVVGTVQVFPVGTFTVWSANGAGGGVAQLQVVGTDNTSWRNVGFASGDYAAFNVVPMIYASGHYATVNIGNGVIATVNPGSVFTINMGLGTVNIGNGLTATVTLNGIPTVNLGLGTVNVGNIIKADARGSLVPTQWIIKATGSMVATIAGPPGAGVIRIFSVVGVADATLDLRFQSPSGTDLTGTMRILPGAGLVDNVPMGTELYHCPSGFYIHFGQVANFGGIVRGWVE